ncbi:MAG: CARDB domain-containing protein [Thermoplasmatota archaeon]
MSRFRLLVVSSLLMMLIVGSSPLLVQEKSGVEAWTDGNRDSPVYPHFGIVDMLAERAYLKFNETEPEKAQYLDYWYLPEGADSDDDSFDAKHLIATPDDNFLAWTDDTNGQPDGDKANYFIHSRKGWEITDAPTTAQRWANYTIENLTQWMMEGMPTVSLAKHKAAYCTARMSRYVIKMSQFGRTDWTLWDTKIDVPDYNPNEVSYQTYYEAYLWTDDAMTALYTDYWDIELAPPDDLNASKVHIYTADVAKWVNSRDGGTVTIMDEDGSTKTVGNTYWSMLQQFMYCWDNDMRYNNTRGFNETLWNLTLENIISATEYLSSIYVAIYDAAVERFLATAPDLTIVSSDHMPSSVIANDMVTINATVRNDGLRSTPDAFIVELSTSGGYVNTKPIQLDAGAQGNITFTAFQIGTSDETITITADSTTKVAESDEGNNVLSYMISPIPEVFSSNIELARPFSSIRRDTIQPILVRVHNTGNRYDEFNLSASTFTPEVFFAGTDEPIGVLPGSYEDAPVYMVTTMDTSLGPVNVQIDSEGTRSRSELQIMVDVLDRSQDPVPRISGPSWSRLGENVTLSAAGSTDPDGDALYFTWRVPLWGNLTGREITFNYTKLGTYNIVLEVYDGNVTSELLWPFTVYPLPPSNLTSNPSARGVSGLTISWSQWRAGGLIAYWLEAMALPGQGERSERGPYLTRVEPGNNSGRIGKFLPDTEVEVTVKAEAERFGNVTMDTFTTTTSDLSNFDSGLVMYVEDGYLYLQYKPWIDPEGEREPEIEVLRWSNGFVPVSNDTMEEIQKTKVFDTIRYKLSANWGLFSARLTYFWSNETTPVFTIANTTEKENFAPVTKLTGSDDKWMLNKAGNCTVHLFLEVDDLYDHLTLEIDWGDGTKETKEVETGADEIEKMDLFHDYYSTGDFEISMKITDWAGESVWENSTVTILKYSPPKKPGEGLDLAIKIIIGVIAIILILVVLFFLGRTAYRFAKRESEVEFQMKDLKGESYKKPGTGTDFDKRREMQIPKESIMGGSTVKKEEEEKEEMPIIKGTIVFDDEDEE